MYRELTVSSDVPAPKLTKALKTGKLSLTANQLKSSGSVIHLHPASYEKALKARKAGRGVRLDITRHEIKKGYKKLQGGSIWSKINLGYRQHSNSLKIVVCSARGWMRQCQLLLLRLEPLKQESAPGQLLSH
ncbi:unnamed protein product [Phytophthora lilii]|uniref:Unnamed protein product n=1 Tax=Phytophthora lilii TaxID=2077276 RepID=A0A9W6TG88_9STRA|nr:unnamed protein product [Phytophthora lilii]